MKKIVILASLMAAIAGTTAVQAHPVSGSTGQETTWNEIVWDQMGE